MRLRDRLGDRVARQIKRQIKKQLAAGRFRARRFAFRPLRGNEAVVVMCLWNRPSRLSHILSMIDAQDAPHGVRLFLWNNTRLDHAGYLATLNEFAATGVLASVDIVRSPFNLGAIARFYWARRLAIHGYRGPVIVLDDDENVQPSFVSTALDHWRPKVLTAWWAFSITGGYWDRAPAEYGGRVDYAGTGGMVCGAEIFLDPRFFEDIPERFWSLDDIWLNYFAKQRGFGMAKLPVEIEFVMHETNHFHNNILLKEEFYNYLYP